MPEKFGVEIEMGFGTGCNFDTIITKLREAHIPITDSRNTHIGFSNDRWTLKRDGSISRGAEIVSPPLNFENQDDLLQVRQVVDCLRNAGATVDKRAGIHVHVDASDLSAHKLANIVRFVYKFEDVLIRIASSGWRQIREYALNQYAQLMPLTMVKKMTKVRDGEALSDAWGNYESVFSRSRYHMVNLESWWVRGTVEFRIFNSSMNPDRVLAYIALSVAIVRDARNGQSRSTAKNYPLGWMATHTPEEVDKLFLRFQQVLTTTTGDGKASKMENRLMSKEHWKLIRMCWADSIPQVGRNQARLLSSANR